MDPVMENLQSHLAYQDCLKRDGIHVCCWTTLWTNDEQHWEGMRWPDHFRPCDGNPLTLIDSLEFGV
jgi:hypothetical protein